MNREFRASQLTTVTPAAGWQFNSGLFTGGTKTDLLGYYSGNGTVWVAQNNGAGVFTFYKWATVSPSAGWQFSVGDFAGSAAPDLLGYYPNNGTLWVGVNTGAAFSMQHWGTLSPAAGWQFGSGFFTGGAKADLWAYFGGNGTLWVGRNTGTAFAFELWATTTPSTNRQVVAGDFTGSGRTDLALYDPANGTVSVAENTGAAFSISSWGEVSPWDGWKIGAGYFTDRAKSDVYIYHESEGSLWVGENNSGSFTFEQWGSASPAAGWQFMPGSYDADLFTDLIGYYPGNGTIWLFRSVVKPIEGYCWPLSAAPGETISFKTSGGLATTATYRRHTSTSATVTSVAKHSVNFSSPLQETPSNANIVGCNWPETLSLTVPNDWTSGFYSATCLDSEGNAGEITFVVKPAPAQRARIALLANANTWLAYNGWGGPSKYGGQSHISFMRPNPGAHPGSAPPPGRAQGGDPHLVRGELWIQGWLEAAGHRPDVYTDLDFHNNGCDAAQYKLLVVGTHPEYWTTTMYDNLVAYLNAGGSLAYLGGNGIFETCAYAVNQTQGVYLQGVDGGERLLSMFRSAAAGRPERSVLGVATDRCAVEGSPYKVLQAAHPLFANTGVANDALIGNAGLNFGAGNGKASGWEADTSAGAGAVGVPTDCALNSITVPPSTLPAGLVVLARGAAGPIPGDPNNDPQTGAEITYYDHPGGGFVFSTGSITFGGSLVVDPVLQQLMRNVIAHAGI